MDLEGIGGLDQTMRLKAALEDEISPRLHKIEGKIRTTKSAFKNFVETFDQDGNEAGDSAEAMSRQISEGLDKVRNSLNQVQDIMRDFASSSRTSSEKIGQALGDAVYTQKVEGRIDELNKDIGSLDKTLQGFANKRRTVSGIAKKMSSTSKDTLNEKVIPAFSDLHGTLEEYPDTLREINTLEQDRLNVFEKGRGLLEKVKLRSSEALEGVNRLKFGVQDAAALITTSLAGRVGIQISEGRARSTQLAGAGYAEGYDALLRSAQQSVAAPISEIQNMMEPIIELRSVSQEGMPDLLKELRMVHKATGLATDELAVMYDQLSRISGIKGDDLTKLLAQAKMAADESTASITDMVGAVNQSQFAMAELGKEARETYHAQLLSASAQASNAGGGPDMPQRFEERLLTDLTFRQRTAGQLAQRGFDLDAALEEGRIADIQEAFAQMIQDFSGERNFRNDRMLLSQMQQLFGVGDLQEGRFWQNFQRTRGTGEGGVVTAESLEGARPEDLMESYEKVIETIPEQMKIAQSNMERTVFDTGKYVSDFSVKGLKSINKFADKGVDILQDWSEKSGFLLPKILAGGLIGRSLFSISRGLGDLVTGLSGSDKAGSIIGKVGGAAGIATAASFVGSSLGFSLPNIFGDDEEDQEMEVKTPPKPPTPRVPKLEDVTPDAPDTSRVYTETTEGRIAPVKKAAMEERYTKNSKINLNENYVEMEPATPSPDFDPYAPIKMAKPELPTPVDEYDGFNPFKLAVQASKVNAPTALAGMLTKKHFERTIKEAQEGKEDDPSLLKSLAEISAKNPLSALSKKASDRMLSSKLESVVEDLQEDKDPGLMSDLMDKIKSAGSFNPVTDIGLKNFMKFGGLPTPTNMTVDDILQKRKENLDKYSEDDDGLDSPERPTIRVKKLERFDPEVLKPDPDQMIQPEPIRLDSDRVGSIDRVRKETIQPFSDETDKLQQALEEMPKASKDLKEAIQKGQTDTTELQSKMIELLSVIAENTTAKYDGFDIYTPNMEKTQELISHSQGL